MPGFDLATYLAGLQQTNMLAGQSTTSLTNPMNISTPPTSAGQFGGDILGVGGAANDITGGSQLQTPTAGWAGITNHPGTATTTPSQLQQMTQTAGQGNWPHTPATPTGAQTPTTPTTNNNSTTTTNNTNTTPPGGGSTTTVTVTNGNSASEQGTPKKDTASTGNPELDDLRQQIADLQAQLKKYQTPNAKATGKVEGFDFAMSFGNALTSMLKAFGATGAGEGISDLPTLSASLVELMNGTSNAKTGAMVRALMAPNDVMRNFIGVSSKSFLTEGTDVQVQYQQMVDKDGNLILDANGNAQYVTDAQGNKIIEATTLTPYGQAKLAMLQSAIDATTQLQTAQMSGDVQLQLGALGALMTARGQMLDLQRASIDAALQVALAEGDLVKAREQLAAQATLQKAQIDHDQSQRELDRQHQTAMQTAELGFEREKLAADKAYNEASIGVQREKLALERDMAEAADATQRWIANGNWLEAAESRKLERELGMKRLELEDRIARMDEERFYYSNPIAMYTRARAQGVSPEQYFGGAAGTGMRPSAPLDFTQREQGAVVDPFSLSMPDFQRLRPSAQGIVGAEAGLRGVSQDDFVANMLASLPGGTSGRAQRYGPTVREE